MKFSLILLSLVVASSSLIAQKVTLGPTNVNSLLEDSPISKKSKRQSRRSKVLPFLDDFNQDSLRPTTSLWLDNSVYINSHFPLNPPNLGVATFDGLAANGRPHGGSFGSADTLTSIHLDLTGNPADSFYLSYYFQPKGLGDTPEEIDSLIVEFRGSDNNWYQVNAHGVDTVFSSFRQAFVTIENSLFLYDSFQFRFRNFATKSGRNDHWHIDYVYLDKNRSKLNYFLNNVGFTKPSPAILKKYTAIPLRQIKGQVADWLIDTLYWNAINQFNTPELVAYDYTTKEDCGGTTLVDFTERSDNMQALEQKQFFSELDKSNLVLAIDGTVCPTFTVSTQYDLIHNASVSASQTHQQVFSNYFSYDDGSAERSYGFEGGEGTEKQLALEFPLLRPDTLRAIQIHFSNILNDVSDLEFSLKVWQAISIDGAEEDVVLYEEPFLKPVYVNRQNGYATYLLSEPVFLDGSSFYVGWSQIHASNLYVGYDLNTVSNEHIYVKLGVSDPWTADNGFITTKGSLMIRPLLGDPSLLKSKDVVTSFDFEISPNPSTNFVRLKTDSPLINIRVFNNFGQLIFSQANPPSLIDVSEWKKGLYFIEAEVDGRQVVRKFIKP